MTTLNAAEYYLQPLSVAKIASSSFVH